MRRLICLLVLLTFALSLPVRADAPAKPRAIQKLKVIVRTGDDFGASTDEAVWLSLGPSYEWSLELPGDRRPFKNGASDTFILGPQGLAKEDIKWVRIRKANGDDWLLQGIEIWIDGRPWYRNEEINLWMEGGRNEWEAPRLPSR